MNKYFNIIAVSLISLLVAQCNSQNELVSTHYSKIWNSETVQSIEKRIENLSCSGNAYNLMSLRAYLGANNAAIKELQDKNSIESQLSIIENLINSAEKSRDIQNNKSPYNDQFMGWTSKRDNGTNNLEVPLYESYAFFYIAQFLYLSHTTDWCINSKQNQRRWNTILSFVETQIWTKWYERSKPVKGNHYWYFLRGRTHMGSHWAGVAMYLEKMTNDSQIKEQCEKLTKEYDLLLKRNLKSNPKYPSAYVWNSTYDNTEGTDASETRPSIIQDVSHGNHVVSYIVAAYELGAENWSLEDIQKLCNTFKKVIYDKKNNTFADNVDGSPDPRRPGWGHFTADGWSKLSRYDKEVAEIFKNAMKNKLMKKYNRGLQLKANLKSYTN